MQPAPASRPVVARLIVALADAYRRLLAVVLAIVGPNAAYALMSALARLLYRTFDPFRHAGQAQCRAALAGRVPSSDIPRIAEQGFVHRAWNLADLMLADRLLHPNTFHRYCRPIPDRYLDLLHDARRRRQPLILVTAYYGSFDLLPIFLGYNHLPAAVVYRPHPNPAFDAFRNRIRARAGCELIPLDRAVRRLPQILDTAGTVALVADHHAPRGLDVTFLGLPTRAYPTVGLLAWRYHAAVVVAGIRRLSRPFRFDLVVEDLVGPTDWTDQPDPVACVTRRTLAALERLILADPSQYLWSAPRWGEPLLHDLLHS